MNSIWWDWPYIIGCNLNIAENNKRAKCNISIATISQNLDSLLYSNLIHSKTQVCNIINMQNHMLDLLKLNQKH